MSIVRHATVALSISLLTACAQPEDPAIQIVEPAEGTTLSAADTVTVVVAATDFTFDPTAVGQEAVEGEGHWHLFLDDLESPVGTTASNSITLDLSKFELTSSVHTLRAQLFNNDHTPVDPEVSDTVEITVE